MFQEPWTENNQRYINLFSMCIYTVIDTNIHYSVMEHTQFSYKVYKIFLESLYTNEIDLPLENALGKLFYLFKLYSSMCYMSCSFLP